MNHTHYGERGSGFADAQLFSGYSYRTARYFHTANDRAVTNISHVLDLLIL